MKRHKKVEDYIAANTDWHDCLILLRKILNVTILTETLKWGAPCYTLNGKNIVGIAAFKQYSGLWFHQGSFLKDTDGVLINAGEGKTKGLRQWRFTHVREIDEKKVLQYILEAIENQKQGKEIKLEKFKAISIDTLLILALDKDQELKTAFNAFTPGKQKEFSIYISSAKKDTTKQTRLEKITPLIKAGISLNDKYRKC